MGGESPGNISPNLSISVDGSTIHASFHAEDTGNDTSAARQVPPFQGVLTLVHVFTKSP